MSVCLFVSNKRQNGWTNPAQIFCGTSRDPREGLWMIKILYICLHQNSIFIKFLKILKIHEFVCENPRIIFVLFYDVHKENMLTIYLEDGREAPSKASANIKFLFQNLKVLINTLQSLIYYFIKTRNRVFATNWNFFGFGLWYFKLGLFNISKFYYIGLQRKAKRP